MSLTALLKLAFLLKFVLTITMAVYALLKPASLVKILLTTTMYFLCSLKSRVPFKFSITAKKKTNKKKFLEGCWYVYGCVCPFDCSKRFNLQLWNFGITFLMWLSLDVFFSNFCFLPGLLHFFYIPLRFRCNFEEQLRKNQWR